MAENKQITGNLASPSTQQDVGLLVDDLVKQISPLESYNVLQELQQNMSYAQLDEEQTQFYRRMLTLLKFGAFSFLKQEEQIRLLQNSLVAALRSGIDVRSHIEHIFLPNFLGRIHEQKVRDLTQALESATEKLGQNPINVGGQVSPEIKNWLLDFKNFSGGKTSAYEIINYLTNSTNAKSAPSQDKEVLRDLLVLYRWLRFDAVPENYLEPATSDENQEVPAEVAALPVPAAPKIQKEKSKVFTPAPSPLPVQRQKEQKRERLPIFTREMAKEPMPQRTFTKPSPQPPKEAVAPVFTENYRALSSQPLEGQSSQEALTNLDKLSTENSEVPASLSGSLINSGSGQLSDGEKGMRPGIGEKKSAGTETRMPVKTPSPKASEELLSVLQKAGTAPVSGDTGKKENGIINLKQNTPTDLTELTDPMQLGRIKLSDVRSMGLEKGLNVIKQKIEEFSQKHQLENKQVAGYFFRSPAYSQYTNTVVTITNDTSGDQRTAFEKINKQLAASGKDHLSREEFLAFHKFKKELNVQ